MRQVTTTGDAYAEMLRQAREDEGGRPTATGTLMRASGVLGCARQLAFAATNHPESDPIGNDTLIAFSMGQHLHEEMQAAMQRDYDMSCEVPIQISDNVSGNADGVYTDWDNGGALTVWEAKSKSNFGFKLAMKDGPELKDCLQAAVNAIGIGAPQIHMVYVCKESDYRSGLKQGQVAEWVIDLMEQFGADTLYNQACDELARLESIARGIQGGVLPGRSIPGIGVIEDPPRYQAPKGAPWQCRYCQWNSVCVEMPTGEVPLP